MIKGGDRLEGFEDLGRKGRGSVVFGILTGTEEGYNTLLFSN